MTKEEFNEKVSELLISVNDVVKYECYKLFKSGVIDVEKYDNDFVLPRIILNVALKKATTAHRPLFKESQEEVKKLEKVK